MLLNGIDLKMSLSETQFSTSLESFTFTPIKREFEANISALPFLKQLQYISLHSKSIPGMFDIYYLPWKLINFLMLSTPCSHQEALLKNAIICKIQIKIIAKLSSL